MENGLLEMKANTVPNPTGKPSSMACVRRRAWAKSRESLLQGSQPEHGDPTSPQQSQSNWDIQRQSEEPGQNPNQIESWLIDCSSPNGTSVDDLSASPGKGTLRNGCSFEDDLSLGAEANHLQSASNKTGPLFGLMADQKRNQYKERGRSMNSTGSGKSSTVSSVSELLDLYEEDPEEILLNLGFGREEPDVAAKIPSRFFNSASSARGIDIKVYLGAQLQRMELENPNYALTSRFRQIEVLTTVANEFFQLYSQVSGQPVQRISTKDQGGEENEGCEGGDGEDPSPLKRKSSAKNFAKLLKKTVSKHNLLSAASESPDNSSPKQPLQLNGHASAATSSEAHTGPSLDCDSNSSNHQGETVGQKSIWKKDHFPLSTVTEETSGGVETDPLTQSCSGHEPQLESADLQSANRRKEEAGPQVAKDEANITSTPEKAASTLTASKLAQLRTENTDSFDMEEIQTNEDETPLPRTFRTADMSRTVSQQSDSSGFAEETSVDSSSYLKIQDSSDSCDSETTVTSHPSQDLATPHALDQPAFDLPDGREEEAGTGGTINLEGTTHFNDNEEHEGRSEQGLQYPVHDLPKSRPAGEAGQVAGEGRTDPDSETDPLQYMSEQEPQPELENTLNEPVSGQELKQTQTADTETPTEGAEEKTPEESSQVDDSASLAPPVPLSPVLCALNRAKQNQFCWMHQHNSIQCNDMTQSPVGGGRGRSRGLPLERSSSLPSTVVSSVKIQFRKGQASCTHPKYSFKYTQEAGEQRKVEEELEEKEQGNCLSTLIINPVSKNKSPAAIPPHLQHSSCSPHSASPPDHSSGGHAHSWRTQSVPDLSSNHYQYLHPGPFQLSMSANQSQPYLSPGQMMFPTHSPSVVFSDLSPHPSPVTNSIPLPLSLYPTVSPPFYHNPSINPYSSITSLHQHLPPPVPPQSSLTNLHQTLDSTDPNCFGLGHLHLGTPPMHHTGYNHPHDHQYFYSPTPHGPQFASPYHSTLRYNMNPHLHHPRFSPPVDLGSGPRRCPSSTELQLRRVLHEIRGTVQSLGQSRVSTPDRFGELRAASSSQQSLTEFQEKRRSLNLFRSQMMDLELSIMQQQAIVYKHLSPADRIEAEQLQFLRSAVREELQELEQQLEDRLMSLTPHKPLHRDISVDDLSTISALRAMEPVSDLLREQLFLQSELSYNNHSPFTNTSSRSSSPVGGDKGDGKQTQGVYRSSVNITPTAPSRPSAHTEEEEEEGQRGGVEGEKAASEKEGAAGGINFKQLIKEIRENVAQEVRQEIYNELLAAASHNSPFSTREHPL